MANRWLIFKTQSEHFKAVHVNHHPTKPTWPYIHQKRRGGFSRLRNQSAMWTITINPHCLLLESIWITIRLPFEFISTRFARDCSRVGRQENIWKTSAKLEHHLRSTAAELRTGKRVPLESQMTGWASATFNTCFNPNEADLPTSAVASDVTSGLKIAAKLPPTVVNYA